MHVCFSKHLRMVTRIKYDKVTEEEGKKRRQNLDRSIVGSKKISLDGLVIIARARSPGVATPQSSRWITYLT